MNEKIVSRESLDVSNRQHRCITSTNAQRLTPNASRSGILLLVVLSMLTLFLLIGTAFIVSANHYRKTQKTLAKLTETSNASVDQGNLLDEVINQLIRDTNNQNSALRFHSLLRDMYGNDGFVGESLYLPDQSLPAFQTLVSKFAAAIPSNLLSDIRGVTDGQVVQIAIYDSPFATNRERPLDAFGIPHTLSRLDNYYNGQVLTWTSGPTRGQSARIIGYRFDESTDVQNATGTSGIGILRLMAFPNAEGQNLTPLRNSVSGRSPEIEELADVGTGTNLGASFVINGRPFNGTGMGYDSNAPASSAKLIATENAFGSSRLLSLIPNSSFQSLLLDTDQFTNTEVADLRATVISDQYHFTAAQIATIDQILDDKGILNPRLRNLEFIRYKNVIGTPGLGGSDESYDAADFQNMILGLLPPNPVETVPYGSLSLGNMILPSLHRPALINYWRAQNALYHTPSSDRLFEPHMLRKVMLRPSWIDHPNFTGGNPEFANLLSNFQSATPQPDLTTAQNDLLNSMIYGPWDVDNDNDGIRDSVWVDFGAPIMENSDGRLVKPMAAILVLDMDGRLNLNAHGSEDIANAPDFNLSLTTNTSSAPLKYSSDILPHGQGYGPAEISLSPLMPGLDRPAKWAWYRRLFHGVAVGDSVLPNDVTPVLSRVDFLRRRIGKNGGRDIFPGLPGFDMAAQIKMQGIPLDSSGMITVNEGPDNIWGNTDDIFVLGGYATPPDLRGRYGIGMNDFGQPVYEAFADNVNSSTWMNANTPYEINLSLGGSRGETVDAADAPYSVAELERLLRAYDPDAGALPSRIWELAGEFKPSAAATTPSLAMLNLWRTTLTTDSYDLPVPSVVVPAWMLLGPNGVANTGPTSDDFADVMNTPPVNLTFADLLEYRLRITSPVLSKANDHLPKNAARLRYIRQQIRKLLPPDLADGLRLDVNRPIGNGRDDNDNGVVDEPGEWLDTNNDGIFDSDEAEAPYWASTDPRLNAFTTPYDDTNPNTTGYGRFRDERILLEDRNDDGFTDATDLTAINVTGIVDTPAEFVIVHNLRRQMLARDLYVLAMTLVDPFDLTKQEGKAKARQLAQWAINIVDFRDPDNIMTAFEYDVNPFDGWGVDGNTNDVSDWVGADTRAYTNDDFGGIVWGAESPEMLISETLAWHDRRTENKSNEDPSVTGGQRGTVPFPANDPNVKIPDDDYDQRFVPQGAGFVELYCPLPANPAANADTHNIDNSGKDLGIDLTAVDEVTGNSPCWRLMIYKTNTKGNGGPTRDPDSREFVEIPKQADRCVYFTDFDPETVNPGNWDDDGVAFFTETANSVPTVRPGRYMVVGAGKSDGTKYTASFGNKPGSTEDSPRGIVLDPTATGSDLSVSIHNPATNQPFNNSDFISMGAAANLSSVAIIDQPRRFTFSEPAKDYPPRFGASLRKWEPTKKNWYYDPPIDQPLDDQRFLGGGGGGLAQGGGGGGGGLGQRSRQGTRAFQDGDGRLSLPTPGSGGGIGKGKAAGGGMGSSVGKYGRTIPGYSWVYLQRLANPLLPWNPEPVLDNGTANLKHNANLAVNPYMTVDDSGVNVTVFNGLSLFELRAKIGVVKKGANRIAKYPNTTAARSFSSLQRGRLNDPIEPAVALTGFQNEVSSGSDAAILGYLNPATLKPSVDLRSNLWNPEPVGRNLKNAVTGLWKNGTQADITHNLTKAPDCTLGFLNDPFSDPSVSSDPKRTPDQPFPWFTWNNRPYANANELLLVPAYRSSQLLQAFSYRTTTNNEFKYDGKVTDKLQLSPTEEMIVDSPFNHLLNFFRADSDGADGVPGTTDDEEAIAGLHRLLDYVHVPSPFVKSETWLNPVNFGNTNVASINDPRYLRQPPFNRISQYREPGRVNLNTIVSADVWDGGLLHRGRFDNMLPWNPLTNNYLKPNLSGTPVASGHLGPLFVDINTSGRENGFLETRRGYPGTITPVPNDLDPDDELLVLNDNTPTFFANPFRSPSSADLVPLNGLHRPSTESTLLRRQAINPGFDGFWGKPNVDDDGDGLTDELGEFVNKGIGKDFKDKDPSFTGVTQFDTSASTTNDYNDTERNAYFAYQPMTRLSSMTTTRSNVYAIWVTVGFFEVEKAPDLATFENLNDPPPGTLSNAQLQALYDRVYPEGYQLGKEAGSDIGDIRRVREFVMIDRTVPVAFEAGQNHNVDKAIRLRRRIE